MSETRAGSQRAFVAVTLITVLAVTTVFVVYAVILSTITGNNVSVIGSGGQMYYDEANSANPADWTSDLPNRGTNGSYCDPWYAKVITTAGYTGDVSIEWTLLYDNSGSWDPVGGGANQTTTVALNGSAQTIYASDDGSIGTNVNWGLWSLTAGETYRVRAVISTV
jgi:hypothetical protein